MGVGAGIALKSLQWFNRGIQFACCGLILALTSYFLAAMSDHKITIPTNLRAVEGISGIGVLYTAFGILLVCCLAGFTLTSFIAIVLDIAFVGAFIYVATVYKDGTSSCSGDNVKTVFGTGSASSTVSSSNGGGVPLPSYRTACRMESANLAVAIVAIFFFVFSAATELLLGRHRKKEQRFGPSPANNYTSGYASTSRRTGFLGSIFGRRAAKDTTYNENELPTHPEPDELRMSYNTETTHVDPNTTNGYGNSYVDTSTHNKYGDTGPLGANAGYPHASNMHNNATNTTVPDTGYGNMGTQATPNYRYSDGTYNV